MMFNQRRRRYRNIWECKCAFPTDIWIVNLLQLFLRVLFGNFIVKTAKLVLNQKDHTLNFSLDLSGANVFQSIYFGGKLFIVLVFCTFV